MSEGKTPVSETALDFDVARTQLRAAVDGACERESQWPRKVAAAIGTVLGLSASRPALMRTLTVDVFDDGFLGAQRYRHLIEGYASRLAEGREVRPGNEKLPPVTEEALIGAVARPIAEAVLMGREATLPTLAADLTEFVLLPYLGTQEAKAVAGETAGPAG